MLQKKKTGTGGGIELKFEGFHEVEKIRSYEAIVEQFVKMIASGQIKPGEQLLPERELASKLSISRTILREAFRVLESMGIIESRIGSGRYVRKADLSYHRLAEGQEHLALYLNFLEARTYIEVGIVELAAIRATKEDLERIMETFNVELNEKNFISHDTNYHLALSKAAHNPVFEWTMSSQLFSIYFTGVLGVYEPSRWKDMTIEHIEVFKAIEKHDSEKAKQEMLKHLQHVKENIIKVSKAKRL